MSDWQPVETMPTTPGSRIRALVETELEMEEHVPSLLMGGWRRQSHQDRIVGWMPSLPTPSEKDKDDGR